MKEGSLRVLRALVNWSIILTVPVWGGCAVLVCVFHDAMCNPGDSSSRDTVDVMTGRKWAFT